MPYCTEANITARKGTQRIAELTGDPSGATVDSAKVAAAIDEFAAKMDNAIRVEYPELPFDETNQYLNGLNVEGAYLLLERDKENGWSESQREEWKMLLDEIKMIAGGTVDLRTETDDEIEAQAEGTFSSNKRLFNRNSLNGVEELNG